MYFKRLEDLRAMKQLTKREVAKDFNVSESTYGKWELGQRKPDLDTIARIAEYYDVSIDYLLGKTDDPTPPSTKEASIADATEALKRYVENKLGREAHEDELMLVDAAADGLIERLKKQRQ